MPKPAAKGGRRHVLDLYIRRLFGLIEMRKKGKRRWRTIKVTFSGEVANKRRWIKDIRHSLAVVPETHLIGLDRVVVTNDLKNKKGRVHGFYFRAWSDEPAMIQIATSAILFPPPLTLIAFLRRLCVAKVLLHELGHHQQFTHFGKNSKLSEEEADAYALRWAKDLYPYHVGFIGFVVFFPVRVYNKIRRLIRRTSKPKQDGDLDKGD